MVPRPLAKKGAVLAAILWGLLPRPLEEGRALWIVRFRLTSPSLIDRWIGEARASGFNALFVQVYGRADAYWRSEVVPPSEALKNAPEGFDPLAYVFERAGGLKVHAWLNVYYAWRYPPPWPNSPRHIVNLHPQWLIRDEEGKTLLDYSPSERRRDPIEGLFLDPSNPAVTDYFIKVVRELADRYPLAGVHLDFVRYPGPRWGFNPRAVRSFRDRWGVDPRLFDPRTRRPDPYLFLRDELPLAPLWSYYYQSLWAEHRSRYVTRLVCEVRRLLRKGHPGIVLSAAVRPDPHRAYFLRGQDWGTWLRQGLVDLAVPMAYGGDLCRVKAQMEAALERGPAFAGLGAWRKPPEAVAEEVRALRRMGVRGFSYFCWQGMKDRRPDYLEVVARRVHRRKARWPEIANRGTEGPSDGFLSLLEKQAPSLEEFRKRKRALERRLRALLPVLHWITERLYPKALPRGGEKVVLPPRVEFEAVVIPLHPRDCPSTRRDALMRLRSLRRRVLEGEDFLQAARGVGGVRKGQLFLLEGSDLATMLWGLGQGGISPVVELPDGYALFRVRGRYGPKRCTFEELPWSLRRVAFLMRLSALLSNRHPGGEGRSEGGGFPVSP